MQIPSNAIRRLTPGVKCIQRNGSANFQNSPRESPARMNDLACYPSCLFGGQESSQSSSILGQPKASHGRSRFPFCLQFRRDPPGIRGPGVNRIHRNPESGDFCAQTLGEGFDCSFGSRVSQFAGHGVQPLSRREINYSAGHSAWKHFLCGDERTPRTVEPSREYLRHSACPIAPR